MVLELLAVMSVTQNSNVRCLAASAAMVDLMESGEVGYYKHWSQPLPNFVWEMEIHPRISGFYIHFFRGQRTVIMTIDQPKLRVLSC